MREVGTLVRAVRRRLPPTLRRQARLEYRVLYVWNVFISFPETALTYSQIGFSALMCWVCQLVQNNVGAQRWWYSTYCNTLWLARSSLNRTAYKAGCLSARWGLVLNCISRLGFRALNDCYRVLHKHTNYLHIEKTRQFPLNLHAFGMAMWTRALCVYRYAELFFAFIMDRLHRIIGHDGGSQYWRQTWRVACINLLKHELDIPFHEMAMVAPILSSQVLFRISSAARMLVAKRLLKNPFPVYDA